MQEYEINELNLILITRSTDELETMNRLIVEILAVRTKIAEAKKQELRDRKRYDIGGR